MDGNLQIHVIRTSLGISSEVKLTKQAEQALTAPPLLTA